MNPSINCKGFNNHQIIIYLFYLDGCTNILFPSRTKYFVKQQNLSLQSILMPLNEIIIQLKLEMSYRKERKPLPYNTNTYNSIREQGSPTKASVLLQEDHAEYIQSLQSKKNNFCTCLDLYRVSYQNQMPQKCLLHNNFITLYCQNQFKLLCVNCIYGSAIHKDHRVLPSKNSISNVARDNQENIRILDQELDKIKNVDIEIKKNKKVLDEEYRLIIKQIDDEFRKIDEMIKKKYNQTKQRVIQSFERASSLNDIGMIQVSWWKQQLVKARTTFPKPSLHEDSQIYKHLVLNLFMQQKIDEEKLTYLPSGQQIRTQFLRQMQNLKQVIEQQIGPMNYQNEKAKKKLF